MIRVKNHIVTVRGDDTEVAAEALVVLNVLINDIIISDENSKNAKASVKAIFSTMQDMLKKKCGLDIEIRLDGEVLK